MEKYYVKSPIQCSAGCYTDLACERRRADVRESGVDYSRERVSVGYWEKIRITSEEGAKSIGRPMGSYDTLNLLPMNLLGADEIDEATNELARELCRMCAISSVTPGKILVVGLGNRELTPDAIGPISAETVNATMHIKSKNGYLFESMECSEIAVIKPDVMGNSGMESYEIVKGVCERIKPDVIFAIDSLAARSPTRLGSVVQISNTGIFPGSGLGSPTKQLTEDRVGIPVMAIGVPTIINSRMFVAEEGEVRAKNDREGMFVCPKEINGMVKTAAAIIGGAINQAFGIYCQNG